MKIGTMALAALSLPLVFSASSRPVAWAARPPAAVAAAQDDDHPRNGERSQDARQQGRQDGMQAAYNDMRDRRSSGADRHREFRHPPVDRHQRDAYREGFREGYNEAMRNGQQRRHHDDDRH